MYIHTYIYIYIYIIYTKYMYYVYLKMQKICRKMQIGLSPVQKTEAPQKPRNADDES